MNNQFEYKKLSAKQLERKIEANVYTLKLLYTVLDRMYKNKRSVTEKGDKILFRYVNVILDFDNIDNFEEIGVYVNDKGFSIQFFSPKNSDPHVQVVAKRVQSIIRQIKAIQSWLNPDDK